MQVVGEAAVRDAYRRGRRKIVVGLDDIVTPQAADAADRLNVRVQRRSADAVPPLGTAPGQALRRTLYRRHPGYIPSTRRRSPRSSRIGRIAILGAGGVGITVTQLASAAGTSDEVVLVDAVPGVAESVATDLAHAAALTGTSTLVRGGAEPALIAGADVVVVAPERSCVPGLDPVSTTAMMVAEVRRAADTIAAHAPEAIVVVAAPPAELLACELQRAANLPLERVLGTGSTIASSRLVSIIATVADVPVGDVEALAMGAEDEWLVPILSAARVRGRSLGDALQRAERELVVALSKEAAGLVDSLRVSRPAPATPAHAVLQILDAIRGAVSGPIAVSVAPEGAYRIDGVFLGLTAVLGSGGVQEVIELPLADDELEDLTKAADAVRRQSDDLIGETE
jgi:malate dehydrogenase